MPDSSAATWWALSPREQEYLKVLLEHDQVRERFARRGRARPRRHGRAWHVEPNVELGWRWLRWGADPVLEGDGPLRWSLRQHGLLDEEDHSTLATLERCGLIAIRQRDDLLPSAAQPVEVVYVMLTLKGRAAARAGLGIPPDRRSQRTRALLHRSLIALILEKGYGRITVRDIITRAGAETGRRVAATTFYNHYRSKDDLLLSDWEQVRAMFAQEVPTTTKSDAARSPLLYPALALFRLVESNRLLYRALLGERGSDWVVRAMRNLLSNAVTEHLRPRLAMEDESQLEMVAAFLVSGLIGLITWWIDSEAPLSADEMYASFLALAIPAIGDVTPLCIECGGPIPSTDRRARYCSGAHRAAAYRRRRAAGATTTA